MRLNDSTLPFRDGSAASILSSSVVVPITNATVSPGNALLPTRAARFMVCVVVS